MQKILIIFPDPHLPYSPTILNLYEALKDQFCVTILNFENRQFKKIANPDVQYLRIPFLQKKLHGIINTLSLDFGRVVMSFIKRNLVKQYLKHRSFNHYIVTDLIGLWFIKGLECKSIHLVSLELTFNTVCFKKKVNINQLSSILIQSKERLDFVGPNFSGHVYYLQNAPVFQPKLMDVKTNPAQNHFIFSGTATAQFGIFQCLDFLLKYPQFKMTMIGNIPEAERAVINSKYKLLIEEGRLLIESRYFSSSEMLLEVSKYRIGFCFYDFSFPEIDNINYRTAPSGKMFTYFATGVPVIGVNIPGLKPILDFDAGVLIDNFSPETIFNAVNLIEEDYDSKVNGCYEAAKYFSFDTRVKSFVDFLNKGVK
jgi:glycosyltransferase involved in cell wall biosynthesis